MAEKIKLLIADDDEVSLLGIRTLLEHLEDFSILGETRQRDELFTLVNELQPDCIVMDIKNS